MFVKKDPYSVSVPVFSMVGKQKMLVVAGDGEKVNGMTASWGSMGILWSQPCAFAFVRDSRFTKQLLDNTDTFSLCFFGEGHEDMYRYMGTVSGRDEDKTAKMGLTVAFAEVTPYYEQAQTVIICKKLGAVRMPEETMCRYVNEKWYADKDFHTMYTGSIVEYLVKE